MVEQLKKETEIPCDILADILLRLDVKSLMRMRVVCKSWLSLIGQPCFMNLHLKRQKPCLLLQFGLCFSYNSSESFDQILPILKFPIDRKFCYPGHPLPLLLVDSQNGVICLCNNDNHSIYLWNPTIKKRVELPPSPPTPPHWEKTNRIHAFHYDPLTNDFIVVKVSGQRKKIFNRGDQVGVYSLRSNSWKTKEMPNIFSEMDTDDSFFTRVRFTHHYVLVNGCIHWMLDFGSQVDKWSFGIVALDLSTEVFKLIISPITNPPFHGKLCNLSGCLSLVTLELPGLIEIWAMKEYGVSSSWIKNLSVDLSNHPSFPGKVARIFGFWNNGKVVLHCGCVVLDCGLMTEGLDLFSYDPKSNRVESLSRGRLRHDRLHDFTTHIESIFLS